MEITADFLGMAAGVILSLGFSYVPGLREWFEALSGTKKRLVMLILLLAVAIGALALACKDYAVYLGFQASCDRGGIVALVRMFLVAMMANQGAFLITPQSSAQVKQLP